ncbi:inactive serine/threonine-protein kinase At1g67470-like [Pistacia vera]|uniref:inactive serine/threonine-protein kinase At1g67470-like n=1 Tax=Pistacia vera TaxID=55513 RepID=UPI001262F6EA|nr:inactive serine/threonine-protein kinase At1g67470-like [Pistacia vera]
MNNSRLSGLKQSKFPEDENIDDLKRKIVKPFDELWIGSMSCFLRTRKHQEEIDNPTFLKNGEILLRELITSFNGKRNPIRAFSAEELKTATSNYDTGNVITRDRYGTLTNRIYRPLEPHFELLLLTHRLKIAMEIANAIAYLHFRFPRPIVFRMIKLSNVVFHEQYVAKLFDFSLSVFIPEGEPHIQTDRVEGTYEYLAPEYVLNGIFSEKSDVCSFGVSLLKVFVGEKVNVLPCPGTAVGYSLQNSMKHFIEDGFNKIVDPMILGSYSGNKLQLHVLAELVLKCVSESAEERPTMIDVAKQLRQMYLLL